MENSTKVKEGLAWALRAVVLVVVVFGVTLGYHLWFEGFREEYPKWFSWLPEDPKSRESVTVIERREQTTISESDFIPRLITNTQNIAVTVMTFDGNEYKTVPGFYLTNDGVVVVSSLDVSLQDTQDMTYVVFTLEGERLSASKIGTDPFTQSTFLHIDKKNTPTLTIVPEDAYFSGRRVLLLGRSIGGTSPAAYVSSLVELVRTVNIARQSVGSSERYEGVMRMEDDSPAISGLPVVTFQGELLGVTYVRTVGSVSETVIIPIRAIMDGLDQMSREGSGWERPYFGVSYVSITPELAYQYNLPVTRGAWVKVPGTTASVVVSGSPAQLAGLRQGDIITKIGESDITLEQSLAVLIAKHHPGDTVGLTVLRDGMEEKVDVVLGKKLGSVQ